MFMNGIALPAKISVSVVGAAVLALGISQASAASSLVEELAAFAAAAVAADELSAFDGERIGGGSAGMAGLGLSLAGLGNGFAGGSGFAAPLLLFSRPAVNFGGLLVGGGGLFTLTLLFAPPSSSGGGLCNGNGGCFAA